MASQTMNFAVMLLFFCHVVLRAGLSFRLLFFFDLWRLKKALRLYAIILRLLLHHGMFSCLKVLLKLVHTIKINFEIFLFYIIYGWIEKFVITIFQIFLLYLKGTNFCVLKKIAFCEDLFSRIESFTNFREDLFSRNKKIQINLEWMKILREKENIAFHNKHHLNFIKRWKKIKRKISRRFIFAN